MTKAETNMLALAVKAIDDILNGLENGNGFHDWNIVSNTWADKSNPIREALRQQESSVQPGRSTNEKELMKGEDE